MVSHENFVYFFGCKEGNTNMLHMAECHSTSLTFTSYQIKGTKKKLSMKV
jgi:hypothetical protein